MTMEQSVRVGRVYGPAGAGDGARILVDRLWPRGVSKQAAALDEWCRAVAPSNELRGWVGHDPAPRRAGRHPPGRSGRADLTGLNTWPGLTGPGWLGGPALLVAGRGGPDVEDHPGSGVGRGLGGGPVAA